MSGTTKSHLILAAFALLALSLPACAAESLNGDLRVVDAAKSRNREAVRSLVAARADVNAAQPDGATAIAWAAHWNDLEMADTLLQAGADVNAANDLGVTPLSLAVINRSAEMVEKLLQAKANANTAVWNGETALMSAAHTGNVAIVKSLLAHGANLNAVDSRRGQSALMRAIADGHPEAARVLIEAGADVKSKSKMFDSFQSMVLTSYGSNVQVTSRGGYTPLLFAARTGDVETVRLLIAKGASINDIAPDEGSALVVAAASGHEKLAQLLLDNGADPNAIDPNGMTALHYAMRDGLKYLTGMSIVKTKKICGSGSGGRCIATDNRESLKFLDGGFSPEVKKFMAELEAQAAGVAKPTTAAAYGYGPAKDEILPGSNMLELAKSLLAKGADPNAQMKESPARLRLMRKPNISLINATPFMLAAASKDVASMRVLAEGRAERNVITKSDPKELLKTTTGDDNQIQGNGTPLLVAAGLGRNDDFGAAETKLSLEAVKTLVEMGADVNQANDTGWTPLHAASFMGADSVVSYLISKGAMLNLRNGCGQTPLSLAAGSDSKGLLQRAIPHPSTTKILRDAGAAQSSSEKPVGQCVLGRHGMEYADVQSK
ncbi:MAG: hypothetical protein EXQ56_13845 [Acidobacteria bacterium]|nr:hypothetical protein [Acidobacteriota bacterium]